MKSLRVFNAVLALTVMLVAVHSERPAPTKGPVNPFVSRPNDPNVIQELYNRSDRNCTKYGLESSDLSDTPKYYQLFQYDPVYALKGLPFFFFNYQECPVNQVFNNATCECEGPLTGRLLIEQPAKECAILADLQYRPELGRFNASTYAHYLGEDASANEREFVWQALEGGDPQYLRFNGSQILLFDSFQANELNGEWISDLKFLRPENNGQYVLVSNDCQDSYESSEDKKGSIELRVVGNTLDILLRSGNDVIQETCQLTCGPSGDLCDVQMVSRDNEFTFSGSVNCINQNIFPVPDKNNCPLALGGKPNEESRISGGNFIGYVKSFEFTRNQNYCKPSY